jgi:2-C-methyl-D-erythritol 4-phosphate cytidylyltransferase
MSYKNKKVTLILVAAGKGTRLNSKVKKQYLLIKDKPVIYYSLHFFENNQSIDEVIIVTSKEDVLYCKEEVVLKYGFEKVKNIVAGGEERYQSVFAGLEAVKNTDIVLIHDAARPFLTPEIIDNVIENALLYKAAVPAVNVKDTIRVADKHMFSENTPNRDLLWAIQTPQAFDYHLLLQAYNALFAEKHEKLNITDDAMVIESMLKIKVKITQGDYRNIKITTKEDIVVISNFL